MVESSEIGEMQGYKNKSIGWNKRLNVPETEALPTAKKGCPTVVEMRRPIHKGEQDLVNLSAAISIWRFHTSEVKMRC